MIQAVLTPLQENEISRQSYVELIRRAASRKDILTWGKLLFPQKFVLPFCHELHDYFIDIRHEAQTNTEAPRAHAKTTIKCFLIPIFQALNEPQIYKHYLNVQSTEDKANSINNSIKYEIETNELIKNIYGDMINPDKWTAGQFVLKNGVVFTAVGAGQSIRGINFKNIRPDYIIVDDLYDEENINNVDSTKKINDWFFGSLFFALAQHKKTCIHVQGTAINACDLLELLKKNKDWKSKTFCAIKNWATKEILWKELKTYDQLMSYKESVGSIIFARECQNDRASDSESVIRRSWLKTYKQSEMVYDRHRVLHEILLGVDPSIGKTQESDYTGIALSLKVKYADSSAFEWHILNLWNEHLSIDKRVLKLVEIYNRYKDILPRVPWKANIEAISGFEDYASEVKRRTSLVVNEINQVKDKMTNLMNKSALFEAGKVLFSDQINPTLYDTAAHQLTTNYPEHDDLRDAVLITLEKQGGPWAFL